MLVRLESQMKHLTSLFTFLIHQFIADCEQAREAVLYDCVELGSVCVVVRFVSVCAANGQQALETSKHRAGGIGIQQFRGEVHESGPSAREIVLQHALENRNELLTNSTIRGGKNWHQAVSDAGLLVFSYCIFAIVGLVPSTIDAVFYVNNG